jgi:RNA polymerase sigma-70 factor, ECF subfamily
MALSLPRLNSVVFEAWLFKIARNVCRDHLRRLIIRSLFVPLSRHHEAIPIDQEPENPRTNPNALDGALKKLSGKQRQLIDLLRAREYSYEELARLTKSSVRAVAGRLFRARARLRKLMRYDGAEQ